MKIIRHCGERLPHGEKEWRRAAKLAAFDGTLYIDGIGRRPWHYASLTPERRKKYGYVLAFYSWDKEKIEIFLGNAPCARLRGQRLTQDDPLLSFFHELGHFRQNKRGVDPHKHSGISTRGKTIKHWRTNWLEISAERYARRMMRKMGYHYCTGECLEVHGAS